MGAVVLGHRLLACEPLSFKSKGVGYGAGRVC